MAYTIQPIKDEKVFGEGLYEQLFSIPAGLEKADITLFPWDQNGYCPVSAAYVGWNEKGLQVYLYSLETETRAISRPVGGSVCKDSCLEFFLNPTGQEGADYFNYECSVYPCVHLGKGKGRAERKVYSELPEGMEPKAMVVKDVGWCVHYQVTADFLMQEFQLKLEKGLQMKGNFYKCGDETAHVHYGIWAPIDTKAYPAADYHRPEYFAPMIIG